MQMIDSRNACALSAGRQAAWLGSTSSALTVVLAPPASWPDAVALQAGQAPRRPVSGAAKAGDGPLPQLQQAFR